MNTERASTRADRFIPLQHCSFCWRDKQELVPAATVITGDGMCLKCWRPGDTPFGTHYAAQRAEKNAQLIAPYMAAMKQATGEPIKVPRRSKEFRKGVVSLRRALRGYAETGRSYHLTQAAYLIRRNNVKPEHLLSKRED